MPEAELESIRSREDGHTDHIAFDVDDIEDLFAKMKEAEFIRELTGKP